MGKNRAAFFRGMDSILTEQSENWISKFEVNIWMLCQWDFGNGAISQIRGTEQNLSGADFGLSQLLIMPDWAYYHEQDPEVASTNADWEGNTAKFDKASSSSSWEDYDSKNDDLSNCEDQDLKPANFLNRRDLPCSLCNPAHQDLENRPGHRVQLWLHQTWLWLLLRWEVPRWRTWKSLYWQCWGWWSPKLGPLHNPGYLKPSPCCQGVATLRQLGSHPDLQQNCLTQDMALTSTHPPRLHLDPQPGITTRATPPKTMASQPPIHQFHVHHTWIHLSTSGQNLTSHTCRLRLQPSSTGFILTTPQTALIPNQFSQSQNFSYGTIWPKAHPEIKLIEYSATVCQGTCLTIASKMTTIKTLPPTVQTQGPRSTHDRT